MAENGHATVLMKQIEAALEDCRRMIAETTGDNFEEMAMRLARRRLWIEELRQKLGDEQELADGEPAPCSPSKG